MTLMVIGFFAGLMTAGGEVATDEVVLSEASAAPAAADASQADRGARDRWHLARPDLVPTWVSVEALFDRALATENENEYRELIRQVVQRLSPAEAREALAWAEQIEPESRRGLCVALMLGRMAEREPREAMEQSLGIADGNNRALAGRLVLEQWLISDLDSASGWVLDQPRGPNRSALLRQVVEATAEDDPEVAFELSQQMGIAAATATMPDIFSHWAERDPEEAARRAEGLPPGEGRTQALLAVARGWSGEDCEAALRWASSLPAGRLQRRVFESVLYTYGRNEPAAALELAMAREPNNLAVCGSMIRTWADRAPREALQYFEAMDEGPLREMGLAAAAEELVRTDPFEAARIAELIPSGFRQNRVVSSVARALAGDDIEIAAAWAQGLPEDSGRSAALTQLVARWASADPAAAAAFVDRLPASDDRQRITRELVWSWARHVPAQAARWVARSDASPMVFGDVVQSWVRHDSDAAARWVESLPSGPNRDQGLAVLGSWLAIDDIPAAWEYVEQISDEQLRATSLERVAHRWRNVDLEAFTAHLEASGVDEATRARLLGQSPRSGLCRCPSS